MAGCDDMSEQKSEMRGALFFNDLVRHRVGVGTHTAS
jgi:hypothetical protein